MTSQNRSQLAASFANDEAALKRGRGGAFGVLAVIFTLAAAGLWFLVGDGDDARVYGELGKQLNGLKRAQFDQFWGCALPGENLAEIKTNTELAAQLEGRAAERGQRYALHLRDGCVHQLREIEPALDGLIVPEDLKRGVNELKAATSKLRAGLGGLISYLDKPELRYDPAAAARYIDEITRGWFEFRKAHAELNKTLKSRLEGH